MLLVLFVDLANSRDSYSFCFSHQQHSMGRVIRGEYLYNQLKTNLN